MSEVTTVSWKFTRTYPPEVDSNPGNTVIIQPDSLPRPTQIQTDQIPTGNQHSDPLIPQQHSSVSNGLCTGSFLPVCRCFAVVLSQTISRHVVPCLAVAGSPRLVCTLYCNFAISWNSRPCDNFPVVEHMAKVYSQRELLQISLKISNCNCNLKEAVIKFGFFFLYLQNLLSIKFALSNHCCKKSDSSRIIINICSLWCIC